MTIDHGKILTQFGQALLQDLQNKTPQSLRDKITLETDDNSLSIYAPYWFGVFEKGRGPTRPNAPKGNPTLQEAILSWIETHSIVGRPDKNGKVPTSESLSWAISKYIHAHGNKLYRELNGGKTDYFDSVFSKERIDSFLKTFGDHYSSIIFSEMIDAFKK